VSEKKRLLCEGAELMNIPLSDKQIQQLLRYLSLILKWNRIYNLSAIRDPIESVKKHLLDSLSIIHFVQPGLLLDVGSGAGLPGIVIAIMKPETEVFVLDSVGKKCRFMQAVKSELALENLSVVNSRVESFKSKKSFSQITSRAFAEASKTIQLTKHLLEENGRYLLMKGSNIEEEDIDNFNMKVHSMTVPFVSDKRSLLEIQL
jgi:16S rRNA (guanine527-N7)-methyltransferase